MGAFVDGFSGPAKSFRRPSPPAAESGRARPRNLAAPIRRHFILSSGGEDGDKVVHNDGAKRSALQFTSRMASGAAVVYHRAMIDDTIAKIQQRLEQSANLPDEKRRELLALIAQLKTEIRDVSASDPDQAQSIAGFAELSTHEATRDQPQSATMNSAISGLESTVKGFEAAHPKLTAVVNRIADALSNLGI